MLHSWDLAAPPFLPHASPQISGLSWPPLIPASTLRMFRGDTFPDSSLVSLPHPLCVQRKEAGTRKIHSLATPFHTPNHHSPGLCRPNSAIVLAVPEDSRNFWERSSLRQEKPALPSGGHIRSLHSSQNTGVLDKVPGFGCSEQNYFSLSLLLPISGKAPKRTVSPCSHPHTPSASYHSRISYVKVRPNFIHPVARRNFPRPQELFQFQDAGARCGFNISPQLWERGLSHGPAHPPLCLCSHSSLPLQCHFILPRDWQGQVEQEEVTQQVAAASRENRTFSSQVTSLTPNSVTTGTQDIPL